MFTSIYRCCLAFGLSLYLGSNHAFGAGWHDFLPPLSDEDIELIRKTAREEMIGQPVGTVLEWANEKSESQGTVELLDRFTRDDRPCQSLRHSIRVKLHGLYRNTITICQTADGSDWEFAEGQ